MSTCADKQWIFPCLSFKIRLSAQTLMRILLSGQRSLRLASSISLFEGATETCHTSSRLWEHSEKCLAKRNSSRSETPFLREHRSIKRSSDRLSSSRIFQERIMTMLRTTLGAPSIEVHQRIERSGKWWKWSTRPPSESALSRPSLKPLGSMISWLSLLRVLTPRQTSPTTSSSCKSSSKSSTSRMKTPLVDWTHQTWTTSSSLKIWSTARQRVSVMPSSSSKGRRRPDNWRSYQNSSGLLSTSLCSWLPAKSRLIIL